MQPKLLSAFAALAMAAFAVGAGSAKADVVFGNITPSPNCTVVSGPGKVCPVGPEVFASGTNPGDNIIANGFSGAPAVGNGNTNLTLKPLIGGPLAPPANALAESGLGVNGTAQTPPTSCTDPECEIASPNSVTAVVGTGGNLITDALVGSVQPGESFNFFVQLTAGGAFTQLGGLVTNNGTTCTGAPGFSLQSTDLCRWDAPAGQTRFGVAVQGVGANVLLTEVSTQAPAVPEPASLALLGSGLAALGLLRRRRRS